LIILFSFTSVNVEEQHSTRKFTSERIFDLEYGASPQISPDGKTVVYTGRSKDKFTDTVRSDLWSLGTRSSIHRPLISGQGSSCNTFELVFIMYNKH